MKLLFIAKILKPFMLIIWAICLSHCSVLTIGEKEINA